MPKPNLKDIKPGYYLAPACYDFPLPASVQIIDRAFGRYAYSAASVDNKYTIYKVMTPSRGLILHTDTAVKYKAAKKLKLFNLRDKLTSPFGLVNWLDKPNYAHFKSKLIIQDSGGFQIAVGRTDFVNPQTVLEKHSVADLGVTLDLPIMIGFKALPMEDKSLRRIVEVTARTNQYFETHGMSHYLNVNHGATINERLKWLEYSRKYVDGAYGLCIAGFRMAKNAQITPKAFASAAVALVKNSGYEYFHFLGVSSGWQMIILASIAARYKKVITSDSSTWLKRGTSGQLLDMNVEDQRLKIPRKETSPKVHKRLWCNCFMCDMLQDTFLYSQNAAFVPPHNLLIMDKVAATISDTYTKNPDLSVSIPCAFVKEDLSGVDDYITGKKTWDPNRPLRTYALPRASSLFRTKAAVAASNEEAQRLLNIAGTYSAWFKKYL